METGSYSAEAENDEKLDDDENSNVHGMPWHLAALILSNSKKRLE